MIAENANAALYPYPSEEILVMQRLPGRMLWQEQDDPAQWPPMRAGYEQEQGAPLSTETLALVQHFAPFQNWCRFAWYWGSDEQPEWVWRGNVRETTLQRLVQTLEVVGSVVHGA